MFQNSSIFHFLARPKNRHLSPRVTFRNMLISVEEVAANQRCHIDIRTNFLWERWGTLWRMKAEHYCRDTVIWAWKDHTSNGMEGLEKRAQFDPHSWVVQSWATGWMIGGSSPSRVGNFSLHHRVQTGSGSHPFSSIMGTRGPFDGGKAAGAWKWPLTSI
jgi:hypothetical protein